ncbi:MAG: alkaline phosphatase family protein [bacterium]|nr:alkaline phosphatase family protein [bacterium]
MSSLRPPFLGPIVGHTTSKSCRLWIRGSENRDEEAALAEDRRTVGVTTVLEDNGQPVADRANRTQYFRLHREFDRTGTFNLGVDRGLTGRSRPFRLEPDHTYRVRMGCLALDDAHDNDAILSDDELVKRLPPPAVWADDLAKLPPETSEAVFRTFQASNMAKLSFLLGSCRYPGILWRKKRSDRIFAPMFDRVAQRRAGDPRFVLMVGDQIYADMLNRHVPVGLADTYQEFQDRYLDAFGSGNMRRLLRNLPAYMILDDHEIEDNWTQDRLSEDRQKRVLFQLAIGAYMSYQWSHGPRNFGNKLFYSFDCGGFPFFVLDLRTQRFKDDDDDLWDNHLLGRPSLSPDEPSQLDHLCAWLTEQQQKNGDDPKFIISSSVFVPNDRVTIKGDRYKNRSDSWSAFPATRRRLLDHIVGEQIQNVVFLSGDVHCSNIARISFSGSEEAERLKAFSIVSSAFYWPFPFADGEPAGFVHDSKESGQEDSFELSNGITMDYTASHFTQDNNFCQVDVDRDAGTIEVQAFDTDGGPIHHRAPVLQLAS